MQHTISIDRGRWIVVDGEQLPTHLTDKEASILDLLLRATGIVTRDMFLNHVYGGRDEPETKIFDIFIYKLRQKLGTVHGNAIDTVWGRGYMLNKAYSRVVGEVAMLQVDIPMEYADSIAFITGKDAQTAILDIVKSAYKQLQEM